MALALNQIMVDGIVVSIALRECRIEEHGEKGATPGVRFLMYNW